MAYKSQKISSKKSVSFKINWLIIACLLVCIWIGYQTFQVEQNRIISELSQKQIKSVIEIVNDLQLNSEKLIQMRARAQEINRMRKRKEEQDLSKMASNLKINSILSGVCEGDHEFAEIMNDK